VREFVNLDEFQMFWNYLEVQNALKEVIKYDSAKEDKDQRVKVLSHSTHLICEGEPLMILRWEMTLFNFLKTNYSHICLKILNDG
jgi:hypothetical protein